MVESWIIFAISLAIASLSAIIAMAIVGGIVRALARRRAWPLALINRARRPFRVTVLVIALWVTAHHTFPDPEWLPVLDQVFVIATIASIAWLASALVLFATDMGLDRYRIDVPDNRVARRIHTQTLVLRRLLIVLIIVLALAAILLTFPEVQAVGTSILASAGVVSIVAGLAAQSVLGNMFAGLQLAFSEAIRVDDVVVVDGEWGRIGEITLSYVVVDLWDERRLVLPCTYFTTKPFQNWTRQSSEILGSVELDVDWNLSPARMREQLGQILEQTSLWDGRTAVLQVTDATQGRVRVRILVTAIDAPTLFDLRCYVREEMVEWVRDHGSEALPLQRVQLVDPKREPEPQKRPRASYHSKVDTGKTGLFTGNPEADRRHERFTRAIPVVSDTEEP